MNSRRASSRRARRRRMLSNAPASWPSSSRPRSTTGSAKSPEAMRSAARSRRRIRRAKRDAAANPAIRATPSPTRPDQSSRWRTRSTSCSVELEGGGEEDDVPVRVGDGGLGVIHAAARDLSALHAGGDLRPQRDGIPLDVVADRQPRRVGGDRQGRMQPERERLEVHDPRFRLTPGFGDEIVVDRVFRASRSVTRAAVARA